MGVHEVAAGGLLETSAFHTSPQDVHAQNTETAAAAERLTEKHTENTITTLTQFAEAAEVVQNQTEQGLKDAVGLATKKLTSFMEGTDPATGTPEEAAQALNGEDGKAFGDFTKLAAKAASKQGIDLANMPIEDAVMMIFMMISNSAKDDVKEQLGEMDATRRKKAAMREAQTLMRDEETRIKGEAHKSWDALPAPKDDFDKWIGTQNIKMPTVVTNEADGTAKLASPGSYLGSASTEGGGSSLTDETASNQVTEGAEGQQATGEIFGGNNSTFEGFDSQLSTMKDNADSLSEMGETQQLKMQMYMDRMTKADTANSNLMKKMADTLNSIIGIMK
jgi:hypothetical protein